MVHGTEVSDDPNDDLNDDSEAECDSKSSKRDSIWSFYCTSKMGLKCVERLFFFFSSKNSR